MIAKFLPAKYVDVEVCDVYEDREAVIVQHTDTLQENTAFNAEALGFKFGIKPCAFHWPFTAMQTGLSGINDTGVMKFGVYIPTDMYNNGTGSYYLPSYALSTLSAAGAAYYGRSAGESKPTSYPNQGQELFDYTNGVKGYDVLNGVAGSENNIDFTRLMEAIDDWYLTNFKRLPTSGADRQGRIGSKEVYLPFYLGIRGTQPNGDVDYYDISRLEFIHKRITSRWENGFGKANMDTENSLLITGINNAIAAKGLFNDFVHWHRSITVANDIHKLHDLYELIYNTVAGRNVWYTGFTEAVEYYWVRTMTKRARAGLSKDGTKIFIVADFDDEYFNTAFSGIEGRLLYDRINQPLSVKIDLTGTVMEGKNIKTNFNKPISLGSNQYVIDIPFYGGNGFKQVVIEEATEANYKNFTTPVVTISENTITSDLPVRVVQFSGQFTESMTVTERSLDLKQTHELTDVASGSFIGAITEDGASILLAI